MLSIAIMMFCLHGKNALKMNFYVKSVKVRKEKRFIEANQGTIVKNVKNGYVSDV